jgi:hypothetical protein
MKLFYVFRKVILSFAGILAVRETTLERIIIHMQNFVSTQTILGDSFKGPSNISSVKFRGSGSLSVLFAISLVILKKFMIWM